MNTGLRVWLLADDPERRRLLEQDLRAAGHVVTASLDQAELYLADLADGQPVPATGAIPLVVLGTVAEDGTDPAPAGVLARTATPDQIEAALRAAAAGLQVRPRPGGSPVNGFRPRDDAHGVLLTPREIEILAAIGEGDSNKQVARRLGISAHTVKFHLEAVFQKLDATTRTEAVAKGLRQRLIEI